MPTKVPHSTGQPQPSSAMPPTRSRPVPSAATPNVAGQHLAHSPTGPLAALAAMVHQSPRVQAQLKLADEIQNSRPVQRLRNVAAAIQMKEGVPINDDPALENEAGVMGNKAMEIRDKPIQEKVAALSAQQHPTAAIQLYRSLASDQYKVKRSRRDHSSLFTTQSKDPSLIKTKTKHSIQHEIVETKEKQDLQLADDGTIAINNTAADAKEFYAADSVFQDSQKKLAQAHSLIKLLKASGLRIVTGGNILHKITPELANEKEKEQGAQFASLISDICIELASSVMGSSNAEDHEAVFQEPDTEEQSLVNVTSSGNAGDPKINRLAALLGQPGKKIKGKNIRERFREQVHEDNDDTDPGVKEYGEKSGRGDLKDREKKLGVNRYARPEVGEGYATFSVSGDSGQQIDYSTGSKAVDRMGKAWGYHFAGVVAKSGDGKDTITLENYNRKDDVIERIKELLQRLITSNMKKIGDKLKEVQPVEGDTRYDIQDKFPKALALIKGIGPGEALDEFVKIRDTYKGKQAWYFKMQGSRKGQSFHEQQAESGGFFNPITLRVRPQNEKTKALRSQCEKKLSYPGLPSLLQEEDEFKQFATLRSSSIKAIQDAETDDLIRIACDDGLAALGKYLLESTASMVVRLTRRHGIEVPDKLAKSVASTKDIEAKGEQAGLLAEHCHDAIENKIQSLWVWETEKKLAMTRDEFAVFQAWEYAPLVTAHFSSNHEE